MSPLSTAFKVVFPFFKKFHLPHKCCDRSRCFVGLKSLIILFCLFCQNLLSSFSYLFPWRFGKVITARLWSKHRRARDSWSETILLFVILSNFLNGKIMAEESGNLASALEINQSSWQTRWTSGNCEKLMWGNQCMLDQCRTFHTFFCEILKKKDE